jgi:hypothetical protein
LQPIPEVTVVGPRIGEVEKRDLSAPLDRTAGVLPGSAGTVSQPEAAAVSFQTSPSGNPYLAKLSSYIATQYPGDVGSL